MLTASKWHVAFDAVCVPNRQPILSVHTEWHCVVHTGRRAECASSLLIKLTRSMSILSAARPALYRLLVTEVASAPPVMMGFARSFANDINPADKVRAASSESASSSTPSDADLPGWLKGPQLRQKAPLAEEWIETADPKSGEKFWRSNVTGAGMIWLEPSMHPCGCHAVGDAACPLPMHRHS